MFDLGTIGSTVRLDNSPFVSSMNQIQGKTKSTMQFVTSYIAGNLGVQAVNAFKRFGVESVKSMMDLSGELANIASIADVSKEKIKSSLMEMSNALGTPTQNANALYYAYSAGIKGTEEQMIKFTETISMVGKATRTDQTSMMDAITTLMNAYTMSVDQAAEASDFFFQVIKQGKATGPELAQSLGMVVGTAATAKIPLNELGAAISVLSRTMPASQAITALSQTINAFLKPGKDAKEVAAGLGIDLSATALQSKGLAGAIAEITEKAGGNVEALATMFTSVEAFRGVAALAGEQSGAFADSVQQFAAKGGSAMKAFGVQMDSEKARWEKAMTGMNKALISLGNALSPLIEFAAALISDFSAMVQSLDVTTLRWILLAGAVTATTRAYVGFSAASLAAKSSMAASAASSASGMKNVAVQIGTATLATGGMGKAIGVLGKVFGGMAATGGIAIIGLSKLAMYVGTAIAGWKIGNKLREDIPWLKKNIEAIADIIPQISLGTIMGANIGVGAGGRGAKAQKESDELDAQIAKLPKLGTRSRDEEAAAAAKAEAEKPRELSEEDSLIGYYNDKWNLAVREDAKGQKRIADMQTKFNYAIASGKLNDEKARIQTELIVRKTEYNEVMDSIERFNKLKVQAQKDGFEEEQKLFDEKISSLTEKAKSGYEEMMGMVKQIADLEPEITTGEKIRRLKEEIGVLGKSAVASDRGKANLMNEEVKKLTLQQRNEGVDEAMQKLYKDSTKQTAEGTKEKADKVQADILKTNIENKKLTSDMSGYMKNTSDLLLRIFDRINGEIKINPVSVPAGG